MRCDNCQKEFEPEDKTTEVVLPGYGAVIAVTCSDDCAEKLQQNLNPQFRPEEDSPIEESVPVERNLSAAHLTEEEKFGGQSTCKRLTT